LGGAFVPGQTAPQNIPEKGEKQTQIAEVLPAFRITE